MIYLYLETYVYIYAYIYVLAGTDIYMYSDVLIGIYI